MKAVIDTFDTITERRPHAILVNARQVKYWTKEARAYQREFEDKDLMTAAAFVINSVVHSILTNFFIYFNKPQVPLKVFTNEKEALYWLYLYL